MRSALVILALASFCLVGCKSQPPASKAEPKAPEAAKPAAKKAPALATKKAPAPAKPATPAVAGSAGDTAKPAAAAPKGPVKVEIKTNHGTILAELDAAKAPLSVANFLSYVDEKAYDGTIFHRVIKSFMIQGGGFTPDLKKRPTKKPIKNEGANGLKNVKGTLAMARTGAPHSATSQFFINTVDNKFLNHPGQKGWGYTVFGRVTGGMDVVEKIRSVPTGPKGPFAKDCPKQDVVIESIRRK
jgi:peptidyl-prolyl cis-trans isomerase B (cyclophilin B)